MISGCRSQYNQSVVALLVASYALDIILLKFIGFIVPSDSLAPFILIATLISVMCAFREMWISFINHKFLPQIDVDRHRAKFILKCTIVLMGLISVLELTIRLYKFPLLLVVSFCLLFFGYKKVLSQEIDKLLESTSVSLKTPSLDYINFILILGLVSARLVAWGSIEVCGVKKIIWYVASLSLLIAQLVQRDLITQRSNEFHMIESNRKITYLYQSGKGKA
jgi:hypothetical protein